MKIFIIAFFIQFGLYVALAEYEPYESQSSLTVRECIKIDRDKLCRISKEENSFCIYWNKDVGTEIECKYYEILESEQ